MKTEPVYPKTAGCQEENQSTVACGSIGSPPNRCFASDPGGLPRNNPCLRKPLDPAKTRCSRARPARKKPRLDLMPGLHSIHTTAQRFITSAGRLAGDGRWGQFVPSAGREREKHPANRPNHPNTAAHTARTPVLLPSGCMVVAEFPRPMSVLIMEPNRNSSWVAPLPDPPTASLPEREIHNTRTLTSYQTTCLLQHELRYGMAINALRRDDLRQSVWMLRKGPCRPIPLYGPGKLWWRSYYTLWGICVTP